MKKRIISWVVMALVMAAMMLAMAMPAFAAKGGNGGGATVEKGDCTVTTPSGGTTSGKGHVVITPNGDQKYKCNTKASNRLIKDATYSCRNVAGNLKP